MTFSFSCITVLTIALYISYIELSQCNSLRHNLRAVDDSKAELRETPQDSSSTSCDENESSSVIVPQEEGETGCQNCADRKENLTVQELRKLRFGIVQDQILQKLQMTRPPCPRQPKPALQPLLIATEILENASHSEEEESDANSKTESIVVYQNNDGLSCIDSDDFECARLQYKLPKDVGENTLASAELWYYKNNISNVLKLTELVFDSTGDIVIEKRDIAVESQDTMSHWAKFVLPASTTWSNVNDRRILNAQISCESECSPLEEGPTIASSGDEKPFLIIRVNSAKASPRNRRSVDCVQESTSCCRETSFFSFAEIGWDDWILHPDGYNANYCRGRCMNDLSNPLFHHTTVLHRYILSNGARAEEMGLTMCCTPSQMSSISIIYRDEEGNIFHKSLPNMKVETCDCA